MASLNLDLDYFDHPKTKRLLGLLGSGAEVIPIRLWCYCGKYHAADGSLAGYSTEEIESIVLWRGTKGKAIESLLKVGFLDSDGSGNISVHDWKDHAFHIQAAKEHGKMMAKAKWDQHRARQKSGHDPPQNAGSIATSNANSSAGSIATSNANALHGMAKQGGASESPPSFVLAQKFKNAQHPACPCRRCVLENVQKVFESMLSAGVDRASIDADIERPDRFRDECIFAMSDRFRKAKPNGKPVDGVAERGEKIAAKRTYKHWTDLANACSREGRPDKAAAIIAERDRRFPNGPGVEPGSLLKQLGLEPT